MVALPTERVARGPGRHGETNRHFRKDWQGKSPVEVENPKAEGIAGNKVTNQRPSRRAIFGVRVTMAYDGN